VGGRGGGGGAGSLPAASFEGFSPILQAPVREGKKQNLSAGKVGRLDSSIGIAEREEQLDTRGHTFLSPLLLGLLASSLALLAAKEEAACAACDSGSSSSPI
jgi:VIT1/CCC1 family predicted Fe2+/Mn2+ transporter